MRMMLLAAAFVATAAPAGAAEESVRGVAGDLAKKVREVAGGLKPAQTAVRIGLFTGSQDLLALGGGGGAFMAELEVALAGFLDPTAPFEVQGTVFFVDDPDKPGLKVVKVKAKLVDKSGDEAAEFKEFVGFVRKVTDIGKITGATVSFKPDAEYKDSTPSVGRNRDFQPTLPPGPGKPPAVQAFIEGTQVRSRKESPYSVEIRTRPVNAAGEAKARTATLHEKGFEGLAFVPIEKGEVYEVVVRNSSDHEVAVSLAIDGIDQFTFSRDRLVKTGDREEERVLSDDEQLVGRPRFGNWIVGPGGDVEILGWHNTADPKRKDNVLSFLVTEYGKGAASRFPTLAQGKVGTITVGIAMSHPKDSLKGGTETGFGPPRELKQTVVERKIEAPHELITVRYSR